MKISRGAPCWTLAWSPDRKENHDIFAVGCWDGTLSFHQLNGTQVGDDVALGYDPCTVSYFTEAEYVCVGGTDRKVTLSTKDGTPLTTVCEMDWVWCAKPRPRQNYVAVGCEDGSQRAPALLKKIEKPLECNLLVVTSHHLILCLEKKLQLYGFEGELVREWVLDAVIRYIKVVGGPEKREGILVGLKNGIILKIFIDNTLPLELVWHTSAIRCLDMSRQRMKIAAVDEKSKVVVYDLESKNLVFEDQNANSVAWNSEFEDMLCYSGSGQLSIKTGEFPVHQQKLNGFVVGFKGSKVFCLHHVSMQTSRYPAVSEHDAVSGAEGVRAGVQSCMSGGDGDRLA